MLPLSFLGERSDKYRGCWSTRMRFFAIHCFIDRELWLAALSWCIRHEWLFFKFTSFNIASSFDLLFLHSWECWKVHVSSHVRTFMSKSDYSVSRYMMSEQMCQLTSCSCWSEAFLNKVFTVFNMVRRWNILTISGLFLYFLHSKVDWHAHHLQHRPELWKIIYFKTC